MLFVLVLKTGCAILYYLAENAANSPMTSCAGLVSAVLLCLYVVTIGKAQVRFVLK